MIPAQALDNGYIVFERNPAVAKRVAASWFAYSLKQASKVKGVNVSMLKISLQDVFAVQGNTITTWLSVPVKSASRRQVRTCLR